MLFTTVPVHSWEKEMGILLAQQFGFLHGIWHSKIIGNITIFFFLFRTSPMAYGGSPARGPVRAIAAGLYHSQPQQCRIWAMSAAYTTAHGNAWSVTHWKRPGIEPTTSWSLVGFISAAQWRELQHSDFSQVLSMNKKVYHSTDMLDICVIIYQVLF